MGRNIGWRKSARSSNNGENCVEVARAYTPPTIASRDSKNPVGPRLAFVPADRKRFVAEVKRGRHAP